jgi:predicted secreted Zn-dependent protease
MANLTLNITDELLDDVKKMSDEQHSSINKFVSNLLAAHIKQIKREQAYQSLQSMRRNFVVEKFNRDELYDRFD